MIQRLINPISGAVFGALLYNAPVQAGVHGLVIGINDYEHINKLDGAVNDAVDVAAAIADMTPSNLVVLINSEATRESVLENWNNLIDAAEPGDTIIVSFAGHGSQEAAAQKDSEADGKDETFLLAGFQITGPASGERIRDDEIAALIARRDDIQHIVVADSCHSGSAIRSSQYDLSYRFFIHGALVDDPLPPPPPGAAVQEFDFDHVTYFGAVGDGELTPEIVIDGKARGALSYAFAEGLRGAADLNKDGSLTKGELETHIRQRVQTLVKGRQKPSVSPVGFSDRKLFEIPGLALADKNPLTDSFDALPPVEVAFLGTAPHTLFKAALVGMKQVEKPGHDGLVVDFINQEIRDGTGDLLRNLTREIGYDQVVQTQDMID